MLDFWRVYWFVLIWHNNHPYKCPLVGLFQGSKIGLCVTIYGKHGLFQIWSSCRYYVFTFDSRPIKLWNIVKIILWRYPSKSWMWMKRNSQKTLEADVKLPVVTVFFFFVSWVGWLMMLTQWEFSILVPPPTPCRCRLSCFIVIL